MKIFSIYFVIFSLSAFSQQLVVKTNEGMKSIPVVSSAVSATFINNKIETMEFDNEEVALIVEYSVPTRIEQKVKGRVFSKTSAIQTKQQILSITGGGKIGKEFENVFSGITFRTAKENIGKISAIKGVKKVYLDATVQATPYSTNTQNQITPNASTTVATGKGIRIGIIDTGIDYNHEAFGSGFGESFTVAGGYDLVNNDSDPMDDNGHGTHVAGIIGGHSSTINGLAVNAKFFAYKALDQNGSGMSSTVIAAIERAIVDSVQVINLSLGTPSGGSEDPLSIAVNRAVEAGIIVVVAAGNTGDYGTINSPGIAKFALTVGATDANSIASFSAKGPVTDQYQIKPDVVAPGVGILSAKKGGGYVQMSGTSMATPFVTAIAAALKELHPDWSAMQIKDAIISNASDLKLSLFSQGHGKIDESILNAKVFTSPAQISFGFNPPSENTWSHKETLQVYNRGLVSKKYQFVSTTINPALQFRFSPQSIELEPSQSYLIEIELVTNNLSLGNNSEFANGYTGNVLAISDADTLKIPFAFFKGTVIQLHFNELPWQVLIHNQKNFSKVLVPKTNQISMIVKDGTYDVAASFYGSRYVVKEDISVSGKADIDISSLESQFPATFQTINEQGAQLNLSTIGGTYSYIEALVHRATGFVIVGLGGGKMNALVNRDKYFSSLSDKYSYGYSLNVQPNNLTSYTYDFVIDSGIISAKTIGFKPEDLKQVDVQYKIESNIQRVFPITWTSYIGKTNVVSVTFYDGNTQPLVFPYIQKTFYNQRIIPFPIYHQREAFRY
ncbi:MAG: S8 family serine peptidase [Bacteroidota bacterium]|nr:S8 family serine peptidase [Bacteroidota bacterium]